MRKSYTTTDIHQKQGQEITKKLYRSISEQAKRLDDARSFAQNIGELFTPNLQIQRKRLCEYCEKLIFSDPVLYGKKGEELLWRKCFYDAVSTAKKMKKQTYLPEEVNQVQTHIDVGIGFYFHIILKLQNEFNLHLNSVVDFGAVHDDDQNNKFNENLEWAKNAIHQSLIYLGDLSRYKLEIYPNFNSNLAIRYYLQAIRFNSDYGMPHNQMGTLAMSQDNLLDAVYHYIRCLSCKVPFEGTTNNLQSLFDRNSKYLEHLPDESENADYIIETSPAEDIKRFISKFLLLIDIWYFNKKVSKVYNLCHQTNIDLVDCLSYLKPAECDSPTELAPCQTVFGHSPTYLNSDMLFKITVLCLLTISKLKSYNSPHLSTVVAFTLAIYSQLLQHLANHIQDCVLNYPLPVESMSVKSLNGILLDLMTKGKKKVLSKLRRKKILIIEDSEESDLSETENYDDYSSSDDSFIAESDDGLNISSDEDVGSIKISDKSSNEEVEKTDLENGTETPISDDKPRMETISKVQRMNVNDMLEIISEETPLQSIKVINDWLKCDLEILKTCGINTRNLLRQITYLLNLINIDLNNPNITGIQLKVSEIVNKENKIPLSEDVLLKGIDILSCGHNELDWNYLAKRGHNMREESVIRIVKLISFGKFLTNVEETGVTFDGLKNMFNCHSNDNEDSTLSTFGSTLDELVDEDEAETGTRVVLLMSSEDKDADDCKGQLIKMKHMGQLWLAAEVRALETSVRGKPSLSPYLVLDTDALIKYIFIVKQLVNSRKFIILVPSAVVEALDDQKREKQEARDAIRWLESQFQRGNRFFRAQRPNEKASIPFIKYPKKKDKEMHIYIQIIECCNFLAEKQSGTSNLVTLLIGNQNVLSNGENKEFSYVGLAQSAGISLESITQFYAKWKKTKGKR